MKLAHGATDEGIVIGNTFDKYGSRNPIVRRLLSGFGDTLLSLAQRTRVEAIHEVGCGEGYWTIRFAQLGIACRGSDFSPKVVAMARENAIRAGVSVPFEARSIYDLTPQADSAPLIVCCEVLEHLEDPDRAVDCLASVADPYLIASVPREPIWRVLNLARGKYAGALGNTPGHLQHWSSRDFVRLLSRRFVVEEVRKPLPWTIALCRVR